MWWRQIGRRITAAFSICATPGPPRRDPSGSRSATCCGIKLTIFADKIVKSFAGKPERYHFVGLVLQKVLLTLNTKRYARRKWSLLTLHLHISDQVPQDVQEAVRLQPAEGGRGRGRGGRGVLPPPRSQDRLAGDMSGARAGI